MIELKLKNTVSQVVAARELIEILRTLLSYEVPNAHFAMRALPAGAKWDGRKRLMRTDGSFPAGLTSVVIEYLSKKKIKIDKITDLRTIPTDKLMLPESEKMTMRDYQQDCIDISDRRPRGIFNIGTGGGKTEISKGIIRRRRVPTIFITPDKGIQKQTYDRFAKAFGAKNLTLSIEKFAPIAVVNIQSLVKKDKKFFEPYKMMMIDEFHHSSSDSYLLVNQLASSCYWRYGFTGTHLRTDGTDMVMHGVLSSVLMKKTASDLIEKGWLVPAEVTMINHRVKGFSRFSYKEAYKQFCLNELLNNRVASIALDHFDGHKQVLILVRLKEHGELLCSRLGGRAVFLNGDHPVEYREKMKALFSKREVRCIIATSIFGEGQDVPSIDVMINARFQESEIQTVQGVGRALRLAPGAWNIEDSIRLGKSKAYIYDFFVTGSQYLKRHSESRLEQYRRERAFTINQID